MKKIDDLLDALTGKPPERVNQSVQDFCSMLKRTNIRITYAVATTLCKNGGIKRVLPFTSPNKYPASFQYMIVRNNGKYHESAADDWPEDAPSIEELNKMRVFTKPDEILILFKEWIDDAPAVEKRLNQLRSGCE